MNSQVAYYPMGDNYILQRDDSLCWAAATISLNEAYQGQKSKKKDTTDPQLLTAWLTNGKDEPVYSLITPLKKIASYYSDTGYRQKPCRKVVPDELPDRCKLLCQEIDLDQPVMMIIDFPDGPTHVVTAFGYVYPDDGDSPPPMDSMTGTAENPLLTVADPFFGIVYCQLSKFSGGYRSYTCYAFNPKTQQPFSKDACPKDDQQEFTKGDWRTSYLTKENGTVET